MDGGDSYVPVTSGLVKLSNDDVRDVFSTDSRCNITKTSLPLDFEDHAFLLENLISSEECSRLIDLMESHGFQAAESDCRKECSASRIMVECEAITSLLWQRMRPFVPSRLTFTSSAHPHDMHIDGNPVALRGSWRAVGLDSTLRFARYRNLNSFKPHFDGFFEVGPTRRTMLSVVIYLAAPSTGGGTLFLDESSFSDDLSDLPVTVNPSSDQCRHRVGPAAGRCLIFNHRSLHEGEPVYSGQKYIIRSDIVYEQVDHGDLQSTDVEALQILRTAESAENSGDCLTAAKLYAKAFKISPLLEESFNS